LYLLLLQDKSKSQLAISVVVWKDTERTLKEEKVPEKDARLPPRGPPDLRNTPMIKNQQGGEILQKKIFIPFNGLVLLRRKN